MAAAFVIVGKGNDVNQPLVARSYARDKSRGAMWRPTLYEAFVRLGVTERTSRVTVSRTGTTYVLPNDTVLLMIGQTAELETGCKVANDAKPYVNFIEADSGKSLQLRYARIEVSRLSGQTDTLIALGATLPGPSEKGWHELDSWPTPDYVTTKDVSQEESLPAYIREIKKNDGKKWING